jgi:NADPH-dependent 2,4-dienoyl-CoA reductase/sulfur reductase-like enzyme/nitrite reductase/ring-hydroxylating ferredoxin subunit
MSGEQTEPTGPDFTRGIALSKLPDGGMLAGHVRGAPVLVARRGSGLFAIDAQCTHYSGPLAEGLLVGDTVRCPLHHACFSLRTGEALRAPALNPVARWLVEQRAGAIYVTGRMEASDTAAHASIASSPTSVVIVGAGAAGNAAAEMLRREGYAGPITMVGAEDSVPYDRPNLSKDFLAGTAPEEWIPLRPTSFYEEHHIQLVLGRTVTALEVADKRVRLDDGRALAFGALLLATGAHPVPLSREVDRGGRVRYLRTLADSRAIIAAASGAHGAVVLGASFIGLEVAASLRARGLTVHVVAPDERPLERVLGRELGDFVRAWHESRGVVFHLRQTASQIDENVVTLASGERIDADLVVAGIGVRPADELAARAGLTVQGGILVNEYLECSVPGIFAAGDVARYPDPRTGEQIRVEHWVVAERQGQAAARNILGRRERFDTVPFFWSQHYDQSIKYVGHAERWDEIARSGTPEKDGCTVAFRAGGRTLAVATVGRDRVSLEAELAMERADEGALATLA